MVVDKIQTAEGLPRGRWPSVNIPCQVASTLQIQFNPFQFSPKAVFFLYFFVNWVEPRFPRPTMKMPSWLFIFLPTRIKFISIRCKKLNWILFFLSSLERALRYTRFQRTRRATSSVLPGGTPRLPADCFCRHRLWLRGYRTWELLFGLTQPRSPPLAAATGIQRSEF